MVILPVITPLLFPGDDLGGAIASSCALQPGDIVAVSSKAAATVEGADVDLSAIAPGEEAIAWAQRSGMPPEFCQAILMETERMNGTVRGWCPGALLTEVRPGGFPEGTLLVANAGLDQSNAPEGRAVGWPADPVASVRSLREKLERHARPIAVILTDSCCHARRLGVTAFALAVSGLDPVRSEIGTSDLFGRTLRMTHEAVADQLATAANLVMGNAAQSAPAAVIREHGLPFSAFEGWVPGIEPERDLFGVRAMG